MSATPPKLRPAQAVGARCVLCKSVCLHLSSRTLLRGCLPERSVGGRSGSTRPRQGPRTSGRYRSAACHVSYGCSRTARPSDQVIARLPRRTMKRCGHLMKIFSPHEKIEAIENLENHVMSPTADRLTRSLPVSRAKRPQPVQPSWRGRATRCTPSPVQTIAPASRGAVQGVGSSGEESDEGSNSSDSPSREVHTDALRPGPRPDRLRVHCLEWGEGGGQEERARCRAPPNPQGHRSRLPPGPP